MDQIHCTMYLHILRIIFTTPSPLIPVFYFTTISTFIHFIHELAEKRVIWMPLKNRHTFDNMP